MKIIIFGLDYKPRTGGIAELTHNIALTLTEKNIETVVITNNHIQAREFDSIQSYSIIRCNIDPSSRLITRYSHLVRTASHYISKENPDCILINAYDRLSMPVFLTALLKNLPCYILVHGLDIALKHSPWKEIKKIFVLRGVQGIIANSKNTRDIAVRNGAKPNKVHIVHPGVFSHDKISLHSIVRSSSPVLLSVGRLVKRKGFDMTIEALPEVLARYPGLKYVIIGDGPDRSRLEYLVETKGLSKSVEFLGFSDESTKRAYYKMANLFVMPNRDLKNGDTEGFGIVYLEAGLHSLPVIGGNAGGVPDAIEDGKSGLLVDPLSIRDISKAIILLLSSPETARSMGEYGRKRAEMQFNWSSAVKKIAEIVQVK